MISCQWDLDFHGDDAGYFESKATLFDSLTRNRPAVLPADSPHGDVLARRTRGRVVRFGRGPGADVRLTDEHSTLSGSSAILETPSGRLPIRTFLLGDYNLDNAAAAAACALARQIFGRVLQQPPQLRILAAEGLQCQLVGFVFLLALQLHGEGVEHGLAGDVVVIVAQCLYELRPRVADHRVV